MFVKMFNERAQWVETPATVTLETVVLALNLPAELLTDKLVMTQNGKLVACSATAPLDPNATLYISGSMLGGKGGFGSMLRSIGAQIERTTNHEAMRDLSGRRQRDVNNEKRIKKYIGQQAEREREAEERKEKKLEKLKKVASGENKAKHDFSDPVYDKVRSETEEKVHSAVEAAMAASAAGNSSASTSQSSSDLKRKSTETSDSASKKPKGMWLGGDDLEGLSDLEDSSDDEDDEATPAPLAVK